VRIRTHAGHGQVTSGTALRGHEGTTFELSCYTDPLGIERVAGSLGTAITRAGRGDFGDAIQLRFTTKFDDVGALIDLPHGRRTRARFSVNAAAAASRFEAGTARLPARLAAMRSLSQAGYPVGLTIAPIMPVPEWQHEYGTLLDEVASATDDIRDLDLSVELITHRFTRSSRETLLDWYPRTGVEMDPEQRSEKRSKFGGIKYVYPRETMREMRQWFEGEIQRRLPAAQVPYWT
jgi:spore photoproduct lyase